MNETNNATLACVGAGSVGASWALNFAWRGYTTRLYDVSAAGLQQAERRINTGFANLVKNQALSQEQAEQAQARIIYTTDLAAALQGAAFIQESVPEHYPIKQQALAAIEAHADPAALIASSTSGLLMTEIAREAQHPQRCLIGHPWYPPHLLPLVEIAGGQQTAPESIAKAVEFYTALGKKPVVLNAETPGLIANRLQQAVNREISELVRRGVCSIEDADQALVYGPGLRWAIIGPMLVNELGGGAGGARYLASHLRESVHSWLEDMADWKQFDADWPEVMQQGVDEELAHRHPSIGNDHDSLENYRDDMLIAILKLHQMI